MFSFNKETPKIKKEKCTTCVPRLLKGNIHVSKHVFRNLLLLGASGLKAKARKVRHALLSETIWYTLG